MQDWTSFVSRFYSLSQERQQQEWDRLTPQDGALFRSYPKQPTRHTATSSTPQGQFH